MEKYGLKIGTRRTGSNESTRHLDPFDQIEPPRSERPGSWIMEAAEMYGGYQDAEELGYVKRG